jgi:hypothetical protein
VQVTQYEDTVLHALHSEFLYVRFFDVDIRGKGNLIKPKAVANFADPLPNQTIIPVVYITTRALNAMSWNTLHDYAKSIADLLAKKSAEINLHPSEIQIDCDWTTGNKSRYFELLRQLKAQPFFKEKTISATIRLFQAKYAAVAGVPPVGKGLLMVYNMDKLTDFQVENSIITEKTAKEYLDNVGSYPLPLDVALPIYSWTLLFHNNLLAGILRDVTKNDLRNHLLFKRQTNNRYQVSKDTLFEGYPLKKGDIIRYESSSFGTLNTVARYLSDKLKSDSFRVLLYHCDSLNFRNYSKNELEKIFRDFN